MLKRFFFIILISGFYISSFSQNSKPDSLTVENSNLLDSIEYELIQDTIRNLLNIKENDFIDTIPSIDTIKSKVYYQDLEEYRDSVLFERRDTVQYIIYNLNKILAKDSINFSDSTKQALNKLVEFVQSQDIKPVITYLESEIKDSSLYRLDKYIFDAVEYLIQSIPEDSVNLLFSNLMKDSVLISAKESELDSVLFRLYDNRGEFAVLWIKKNRQNVIDLFLEDGFYLEKTKRRDFVAPILDVYREDPQLKKVEKVNIILPIWKFEGLADIKFNQGYISQSWAEGGENSLSALSVLKYSADYSYGKKRDLDTDVEYRLGYLKAGDNDLQKNDDKFEINAKYGKSAFRKWYYSGLLNFKTQFLKGFDNSNDTSIRVSEFLSPAYMVFSLGLDYKPSSKLTILFSPLTSKFTIVADTLNYDQTRFGVGEDEMIRKEIGAYVKAISKIKFREIITLENKVNFFTNYSNNPQNIDVDWEANLGVNLTEYIKMSINAHFIYDDDVTFIDKEGNEGGARAQFKELFGIGFTYSF